MEMNIDFFTSIYSFHDINSFLQLVKNLFQSVNQCLDILGRMNLGHAVKSGLAQSREVLG